MDHQPEPTPEFDELLDRVTEHGLEFVLGVHDLLHQLSSAAASLPGPAGDDATGDPDTVAVASPAEPAVPDPPSAPRAPTLTDTVERLDLIKHIRALLHRIWPNTPARQSAFVRGYMRPRGHNSLSLASAPTELLRGFEAALEELAPALRPDQTDPDHVDVTETVG